jgi:hypothetical protein
MQKDTCHVLMNRVTFVYNKDFQNQLAVDGFNHPRSNESEFWDIGFEL